MRLTTTTNVSVDGVMQGLGGPDEDRSGGFDRGGWAIPLLDTETGDYLNQIYGGAAAFLFGRRTYEIFAGYWGAMADPSTNPIAAALNSRPGSSTPSTPPVQWTSVSAWRCSRTTRLPRFARLRSCPSGSPRWCADSTISRLSSAPRQRRRTAQQLLLPVTPGLPAGAVPCPNNPDHFLVAAHLISGLRRKEEGT